MTGMTLIVRTISHWLKGFIFLYGIYIVLFGHLTPGGGFAGGVIIACAFVLMTLAFGKEKVLGKLGKKVASELDSVGALLFLLIAFLGLVFGPGKVFFFNFLREHFPGHDFQLLSAGVIPVCNIAIGLKVETSLFMVFIILAVLRVVVKDEEREMVASKRK